MMAEGQAVALAPSQLDLPKKRDDRDNLNSRLQKTWRSVLDGEATGWGGRVMDTARRIRESVLILTLSATGVALVPAGALGQVRERDVTITGPRGRTVERHLESRMGPNGLTRDTTITRPGGTFHSESHFGGPPPFGPGPRNVIVERNVFVNGGNPGINPWASFGLGAALGTGAGILLDRTVLAPPPPVFVGPPVYFAPQPPPTVIYNAPVPYLPAPPAQTIVVDPVAQQIARLTSHYAPSRREASAVLGRLGDARAVPALVERLKLDTDKSVRITAAQSLARIGDPKASIFLERSSIYDKKQEVRDAAAAALARMPRVVVQPPRVSANPGISSSTRGNPDTAISVPLLENAERVPPPPTPATGYGR